jgi:hypothetical protein
LAGFGGVERDGVTLTAGFTAPVNAELKLGTVEETLTVTGVNPVVDVVNVRSQNVLSQEVLNTLPTGRSIPAYAALTLGTTAGLSGQDVGGNRGDLNVALSVHGSRSTDQRLLIDGMPYNHIANAGGGTARHFMIDHEAMQEIVLETGSQTAESPSGGILINAIPKDGGNRFSGSFQGLYVGPGLQKENLDEELETRGVRELPGIRKLYDAGGSLGGPLKVNHLWFFTSHRAWGASEYIPAAYFDKTPESLFYTQDLTRQAYTSIPNRDHSLRLTWQTTPKHKVTFMTSIQENCL